MSIHPSLVSTEKGRKQRSVLKRTERLKLLLEKGQWREQDNVFGLPKIKTVRIKIKKAKAAEKTQPVVSATGGPTTPSPQESIKGPATKSQEKK